ncbi:hypothetical protein MCEMIEM13_01028 [Comamonadaceae bacterium]
MVGYVLKERCRQILAEFGLEQLSGLQLEKLAV